MPKAYIFEAYRSTDGQYFWRATDDQGKLVLHSAEGRLSIDECREEMLGILFAIVQHDFSIKGSGE